MLNFAVIIATLIFLIPTSGLSLVGLTIYLFLKFGTKFYKVEKAIVALANNNPTSFPHYAVGNIQYSDVVGYAEGQERIKRIEGQLVEFEANIKGNDYTVVVAREPLGSRAILGAKRSLTNPKKIAEI